MHTRRLFLLSIGAGLARGGPKPTRVRIASFDDSGRETGVADVEPVVKPNTEWARLLTADSYSVTRLGDTEFPGSGPYDKVYESGIYRCICCATALFSSKTKYASGTGWPSFTGPIAPENVLETKSVQFGEQETEVKCARCQGHLGHVFDDGPPPRGLRYCINSAALRLVRHNLT